jgi:hypothetical protein
MWLSTHSIKQTVNEADGFLAENLNYVGFSDPPASLATTAADHTAYLIGSVLLAVFVLFALIALGERWMRKARQDAPVQLKTERAESGMPGDTINQTHYGFGNNIGKVQIGAEQRKLNDGTWGELRDQLLGLPKDRSWHLLVAAGDGEARSFAFDIKEFLKANGFKATGPGEVMSGQRGPRGIVINIDNSRISVGSNE